MRAERIMENGFMPGSQAERIDAVISHAPMTLEEIARAADQEVPRVRSHVEYWISLDLFYGRTQDGRYYRLNTGPQPGKGVLTSDAAFVTGFVEAPLKCAERWDEPLSARGRERTAPPSPAPSRRPRPPVDAIDSLAQRRGFDFQTGEIYAGTRSDWDNGPLGVESDTV